ncbi:MAG: ATP-grasp domain-containing protein [Gammaproteobacteria bacterium]|nr:ATP-grasp domain-containing protein [Gammaproteobacteria bacterium]
MRNAVFVVPFFMEATLRFVAGAASLPGVRLGLVSQDPAEKLPEPLRARVAAHWRIDDALDAKQILRGVNGIASQMGKVERLVGSLEQLQVPLAQVREHLGLPGLSVQAANRFRDKSVMKSVFEQAGLPCARHRLIRSANDASEFIHEVGFPIVVKPPAGAGAVSTFRLDSLPDLTRYLHQHPPQPARPMLFEEFLRGEEFSFDSVCIDGRIVWYSISSYSPSPLTVVENPWIQWCVLLPRRIDGPQYDDIRSVGRRALDRLGIQTGLTHMEWFRREDGSLAISEVGARPPGAQFTTLISYACNLDFYRAWPRLMLLDEFDVPQREYATGAAYLRGMGQGRVKAVHGLAQAQKELGALVVEARLPKAGQAQASGYEGSGYLVMRHPETRVVEQALARAVELIRVELA